VRALILWILPALAYADTFAPPCAASQMLSNTNLAGSGCVAGNVVFSNFSATSIGIGGGMNLTSMEIEFLSGTPELEFSGGLIVNGGSSGSTMYEVINYDVSALDGAPITDLMLGLGNVDDTAVGGTISALEIVTAGTGDRDWASAVPGDSASIRFGTPQTSVHVTDIVRLQAAPNSTVTIGGFANRLLVNAEPGTLILLGTVLIVLVRVARRALPN
jgi:hypothetical protein